ncbi:MAG: hypothetical protein QOF49_2417, partial [Chloroflexota bacterium]|nr:hypothetical protein [Chloroflexota bacterium]
EQQARDVGLSAAIEAYLALGAPAPEAGARGDVSAVLDPLDADSVAIEPIGGDEVPIDPDEVDLDLPPTSASAW